MPPDSPPALSARPWRSIGLAFALILPVGGSLATAGPVSPSTAVQNGISVGFSLLPAGPDKPGADGMRAGAPQALGATSIALVGTPDEVASEILRFKSAGVSQFIFHGWPKWDEMRRFGRDVIPARACA